MERGHGIEQWLYDHQEEIDFWCFFTSIAFVLHTIFVGLHWVLSTFFQFTYLWVPVMVWVLIALGRTAVMFLDEHMQKKEERDEHEVETHK